MAHSTKFAKNLEEDKSFKSEQQKALLGFIELEKEFKESSALTSDKDKDNPSPPEDSGPSLGS